MKNLTYILLFFVVHTNAQIKINNEIIDSINFKNICPLIKQEISK
jgi:hypothetical protein